MHKNIVARIFKATQRKYSAEEKIRTVFDGLQGEIPFEYSAGAEGGWLFVETRGGTYPTRLCNKMMDLDIMAYWAKHAVLGRIRGREWWLTLCCH